MTLIARIAARLRRRTRYQPRHAARATLAPAQPDTAEADRALVAAMNAGHWTAADYLEAIGFPEAERYASAFGRKAAEVWRAQYGTEPFSACGAYVNGRVLLVFGYPGIDTLHAAAYEYKRTREFLHNRRCAALLALTA